MSLQPGNEIDRARRRIEEQQRGSMEALLAEVQGQRAAAEQEGDRQGRMVATRLQALDPASRALAELLVQLERRTPEICRQPLHEVTVSRGDPAADCVRVSLRWGTKFGLTDTEKHLMHSYRTTRRRWRRYPEVVVAHEYREVWGVLDGSDATLRLSSGHVFPVEGFVEDPALVMPHLSQALAIADRRARYHLRSTDYEASPTRR